jgi:uncharacterized membrane protein
MKTNWRRELPSLLLLAVMLVLLFAPRIDPGRANYASFPDTYLVIRTAVLATIALFYGLTCLSARGVAVSMEVVAPLAVGVLFVVLGSVMGKIRPNWFVGVRTPWTISSKVAWVRTHRLGGWLFIVLGLAFVANALVGGPWSAHWLVGAVLAMVVVLFVYSYFAWRGDPDKVPPAGTLPGNDG